MGGVSVAMAAAAVVMAVSTAHAASDGLTITPGRINRGSIVSATFSIKSTRQSATDHVFVECAILDEAGTPQDTGVKVVEGVMPGEVAYGEVGFENDPTGSRLGCRITGAR